MGSASRSALIVVYDGDDPRDLSPPISQQLTDLQSQGGSGFVFGMGEETAARPVMRAFGPHALTVNSGRGLLEAYATAFKVLLGTRKIPPTGRGPSNSIHVPMPKGADSAWFVALADDDVTGLEVVKSPGGKASVSTPPGSGWNFGRRGAQGGRRGYRVLRIDDPAEGDWFFKVQTQAGQVDWLLLPVFDLKLDASLSLRGKPRVGQQVPLVVKLKGKVPPGTKVTVEQGGARTELTCKGDRCHGFVIFDHPGKERLKIRGRSDELEVNEVLEVDVEERIAGLLCDNFKGGPANVGAKLTVVVQTTSSGVRPQVARLELSDGRTATLRNDGKADDRIAADRLWTASVNLNKVGPLRVTATMRTSEGETECVADFEVLPCVDPVMKLPPNAVSWGPCQERSPDASCEACAGGCTGVDVRLDVSATQMSGPVTGQLRLGGPLPRGVTAWTGSKPLSESDAVAVKLGRGLLEVPIRLCSDECPGSGSAAELALTLTVPNVFSCARPEKPGEQTAHAKVALDPKNVGWLYCWRVEIGLTFLTAFILFIIWGFIRPLRFPRATSRAQAWPRRWETCDVEQLPMRDYLTPSQATRPHAHGGFWWTDQRLYFSAGRSAQCDAGDAVLTIELLRERPPEKDAEGNEKGPATADRVCWIRPRGARIYRTPRQYSGQSAQELDVPNAKEVPVDGEPLRLGTVYLVRQDRPFAVLFT